MPVSLLCDCYTDCTSYFNPSLCPHTVRHRSDAQCKLMRYSTPINAHTRLTSLLNLSHYPSPCISPPPPIIPPLPYTTCSSINFSYKFNITLTFPTTLSCCYLAKCCCTATAYRIVGSRVFAVALPDHQLRFHCHCQDGTQILCTCRLDYKRIWFPLVSGGYLKQLDSMKA